MSTASTSKITLNIYILVAAVSTDFEVHRNWLAITHSLPMSKWYYENTSEWTLDYPPFFAYFEWMLSQIAQFVDPGMLNVNNLNYSSSATILFQKFSVICCDLVLVAGVLRISTAVADGKSRLDETRTKLFILIFLNGGLFIIDHIHFQYNGFLYGILLLSIASILQGEIIRGAILFSALLNFKHIYLYIAPAFGVYLFRRYCLTGSGWKTKLHYRNLLTLATAVILIFAASFGPFYRHFSQILSRLFPFKRGLCHAYWAPNIWAIYNTVDLGLNFILKRGKSSLTGGLVGETSMMVLPNIVPLHTFVLTLLFMLPSLLKIVREPTRIHFLNAVVLTAWTSFMFGYHVHEKAILNVIIPLAIVSTTEPRIFFMTLVTGTFSVFPLLFTSFEIIFKLIFGATHIAMSFWILPRMKLHWWEETYLGGFVFLFFIENIGPLLLPDYPFLPLIFVSNYCFVGNFLYYALFYWRCLTKSSLDVIRKSPPKALKKRKRR